MNCCVVGTDETALGTAIQLAYLNNFVVMVDDNQAKINSLKNKAVTFPEPKLNEIMDLVGPNLFFTTNLTQAIETSETIYYCCDTGYTVGEVAHIFQENIRNKFRLLVNKSTGDVGATENLRQMILERSDNFTIAFEIPYISTGKMIRDIFYPEKIAIGVQNRRAQMIIEQLYKPIIQDGLALPESIARRSKVTDSIIWTDPTTAELAFYGERIISGVREKLQAKLISKAQSCGAEYFEVQTILSKSKGLF